MTGLFPTPDSWTWTTLGEIADVVGGVTKDSKKQSDPALPLVPYLRVANVQRGYLDLEKITEIRVPERTVEKLRLQPGDVLLNEGGDRDKLGRGWVWNGQIPNCIHQNHVFRARLAEKTLHPKLLAWFANDCARDWFEQNATQSVNLASISLSKIKQLPIPLPPYEEQFRIVEVLEDHLSRLDIAMVTLAETARRSETLRRRILTDLVTPDALNTWTNYRLSQVANSVRNGMFISRAGSEPDGVPILRIGAVRSMKLDLSDLRYSAKSAEAVDSEGYLLESGDLLFTRYNGSLEYVGVCAVVPHDIGPMTYPDKLIRVSPNKSLVVPEYLAMTCSAGASREVIRSSVKTTAGQAGISGKEIKNVSLRLPNIDEQRRRVAVFREYDDGVRRLQAVAGLARQRGNALRRSLLTEAFAGRLLRQDPRDEQASVLLERIKSEPETVRSRARRTSKKTPQKETLL
jgi:restriction endonuclease S subunit